MSGVNWNILQPVDIGAHLQAGYRLGSEMVRRKKLEGALAAYAMDPTNPETENALAALDPRMALEIGQRRAAAAAEMANRQRIGQIVSNPDHAAARRQALEGGDIELAKQIDALSKEEKEAAAGKFKYAAPVAYRALKLPYEQRKGFIETARPQLEANGWSKEAIDAFDPTDEALGAIVTTTMTLQQAMERDNINYKEVGPGARLVPFDSTGRPVAGVGGPPPIDNAAPAPPGQSAVAATLSAAGLPAPVVAGFLGNFEAEGGYSGAKGDGGTAHGIAQWRGERQTNFQRVIGKPVSQASHEEQAKFVLWEMQNPEAAGMTVGQRDAILAAKTPAEAAALIDQYYERSSGEHRGKRVTAAARFGGTGDQNIVRQQAQEAIAAGADPAAVKARAASMGVTL